MEQINPKELMEQIKSMKHKITNDDLSRFYDVCLEKLDKYIITGQIDACNKIKFLIDNVNREYKLIEHGIDTFVYFNDIRDYIDKVKDKQISIIELSRYEREIPDDIIDVVALCREHNLFDEYIVLFTDYQKEMSKKTAKQDREKDPILFGMMYDDKTSSACPRFYYLGDWEDNYCDLTLEKMLAKIGEDKEHKIEKPLKSIDELNERLNTLTNKNRNGFIKTSVVQLSQRQLNVGTELYTKSSKPRNVFKKIKSIFKKGE